MSSDSSSSSSSSSSPKILQVTRHLLQPNGSLRGSQVSEALQPLFPSFSSAITASSTKPFLASIDGRKSISHGAVLDFITRYYGPALQRLGVGRTHRVALVLPNGPELALCIAATVQWASCVPLSANAPTSELEADLARCGATLVIGPYSGAVDVEVTTTTDHPNTDDERFHVMKNERDWTHFRCIQETCEKLNIPFVGLVPSPAEAGIFRLVIPPSSSDDDTRPVICFDDGQALPTTTLSRIVRSDPISFQPNAHEDEVLVLFTSGTTGNKKLVPHQLLDLLTAATTIALSWNLTVADVNCNLMPLFHVGGIVRQIFSPLVSGGCVICCPSFDPSIFWSLLSKQAFTWYYAAPTMHQLILQTHDEAICPNPRLRMIANAAGGLLPSLALQLRDTFGGASVLPSYGMTECMPITSPPYNYQLTKPGTSGVPVGPELCILNPVTMESVPLGVEGSICVRGEPCFRGYGKMANDNGADTVSTSSSFLKGGWFNTGDLGYLDEDGYLFISGRSKEVINRGGEIISPMEVEEAVTSHPDVVACAAFSAAHSVLQEVVGLVLVMKESRPRLDLRALHVYLGERLAAPKWPQVLVYMNGLPKSHTNKLLRVKLGSRLGLPELNDGLSPFERLYEGKCPPKGANLDVPILVSRVKVSALDTEIRLRTSLLVGSEEGKQTMLSVIENPTCKGSLICYAYNLDILEAIAAAQHTLDGYAVPTHFIELDESTAFRMEQLPLPRPTDSVVSILQAASQSSSGPVDPLVESIQNLFVQLLKLDCVPAPDANFFHLGGSSLLASQFASQIRKQFGAACSGAEIFSHSSPEEIADMIRKRSSSSNLTIATSDTSSSRDDDASELSDGKVINDHGAPFSSTRLPIKITWWSALVQLIPALVLLPLFQVTRYMLFFAMLLKSLDVTPGERDLWTFVLAYLAFHLCWITVTPLVFVAIKWIVVGKYRKGRYPLYGTVYLRWWFVDVCRQLFLRGIWGSNETFLNFYYRLLGAKIGKGARISLEADIAEFDLVSIGENAAVEMSTVRAFGVDNGAMILGPVSVGKDASVGVRSVVAPFTSVPDCKHLGPLVSSYDVSALDETHARTNRRNLPEPNLWMQFFVAAPIAFLVNCVGQLPPLLMLWGMLCYKAGSGEEFNGPNDLIAWLCDPYRIPFYFGIRIARALVAPFFYMGTAIAVKKFLIGRFEPGRRNTNSQWQLTRHHLVATLFSRKKIQAVTDIIGRHYELVSCLYRMMGARVGKRVFWPGNQPVFSGEFDLLVIGDDVVFGSRSCIFFTTTDSCEKVILSAGANVADNCVVLPGSIVGKNAVLGSNSVCPPGWYLPELSLWLGAKGSEPTCLERGPESDSSHLIAASAVDMSKLQVEGDASTIRPFGKAFYERKATYYVWSLNRIIWTTVTIKVLIAVFHSLPLLTALQGAASLLYGSKFSERDFVGKQYNYPTIYLTVLYVFLWVNVARLAVWFAVELIAKWSIIGRRAAGRYNYDSSDYAQRWELYQLVAKVRAFSRFNFLQFFFGSPYMTYFFRFMGGQIGKDCCLYPSGADPFMPEPDLVEMGDRCVVDCASIVCHLNTRGNFELVKIVMEDDCTLRSRSRVQQGVYMEQGSQLLEKSLAMTGEVIDAYSVWHGSPAAWWFKYQQIDVPFANDVPLDDSFDETTKLLKGKTASYYAV